jgi:hypothetical protein
MADHATLPAQKADLLEVEQRWLALARGYQREPSRERFRGDGFNARKRGMT